MAFVSASPSAVPRAVARPAACTLSLSPPLSPTPSPRPISSRRALLTAGALAAVGVALGPSAPRASAAPAVQAEDVKEGTGAELLAGVDASVKMHYTLTLGGFDGRVVDSSRTRGRPFSYRRTKGRGGVIAGWDEGVTGMKVGGRRRLVIPPELGYGERDVGPIPAGSVLYFDIELLGVSA
jgi:FKBP-type peptidyl-prolyl cis-trans isomerase FkpA